MKFDPDILCPLCGINEPENNGKKWISREHIPPKSLFVERTADLITVPSCKKCNNGTSDHDYEFMYTMGLYLGDSVPEFWEKILHSLNKNSKRKKRKKRKSEITSQISPILERGYDGQWGHCLEINKEVIKSVVTKITKGLHWHVSGYLLPSDTNVTIKYLQQGEFVQPETQKILDRYGSVIKTGCGVFEAQYAIIKDNKFASIWKISFYSTECFVVILAHDSGIKADDQKT